MRRAIALAWNGWGRVAPNPMVGCVIVRDDGQVVGERWHTEYVRPHAEVEALRAMGLARGGTLENVVVIEGDRVLNPEGLRRPDEFVRHKALDAIGDLYVLGMPILGRFEGELAGHAINNQLCRALMARPDAWRVRTFVEELAQAV